MVAPDGVTRSLRRLAHRAHDAVLEIAGPATRPSAERQRMLLLGTGRGGTTALMAMYSQALAASTIFEPLAPHGSRHAARVVPSHGYPHLSPSSDDPALEAYLDHVLQGRRMSRWSMSQTSLATLRRSDALVVKEVRANRVAGWFQHRFPEVPLRVVLRHPLDVVQSMQRATRGWSEMSFDDLVQPAADALGVEPGDLCVPDDDPALRYFSLWLADTWCVLNETVSRPGDRIQCFEDFLIEPEGAVAAARGDLLGFSEQRALASLRLPSATASPQFLSASGRRAPGTDLRPATVTRIRKLLEEFDVNVYAVGERTPQERPSATG